jgi:hypothetical protein
MCHATISFTLALSVVKWARKDVHQPVIDGDNGDPVITEQERQIKLFCLSFEL